MIAVITDVVYLYLNIPNHSPLYQVLINTVIDDLSNKKRSAQLANLSMLLPCVCEIFIFPFS